MARSRVVGYVALLLLVGLALGIIHLFPKVRSGVEQIDASVQRVCAGFGASNGDSCVKPLVELLEDETNSYRLRNEAIWVLGQLADPRALPALEAQLTGLPCAEPCSRDRTICQDELRKAIRWCSGEAWLMRGFRWLTGSPW